MAALSILAIASFFGSFCAPAIAQVYKFDSIPVPPARTVDVLQAFYLDKQAQAIFQDLAGSSAGAPPSSVSVGFLGERFLAESIDTEEACSAGAQNGKDSKAGPKESIVFNGAGEGSKQLDVPFESHGIYYLIIANCGDEASQNATVTGMVKVKHTHGFMPGTDYHKESFYGWLALLYIVVILTWLAVLLRWYQEIVQLHHHVTIVTIAGFLEAALMYGLCYQWNATGEPAHYLFCLSRVASVLKMSLALMVSIALGMGWGTIAEDLACNDNVKLHGVVSLYVVLEFFAASVLSLRHERRLAPPIMLGCLGLKTMVTVCIFIWIFTSQSSLIEMLKERNMEKQQKLFQSFLLLGLVTAVLLSVPLGFQALDISQKEHPAFWQSQWVMDDVAPQMVFLFSLICAMVLVAPEEGSHQYLWTQLGTKDRDVGNDEEGAPVMWVDEDTLAEEKDEEGDLQWTTSKQNGSGVAPTKFGAE